MKKTLIAIIILASALRLFDLAGNRPHLTNDEAALGYNAYSILKTGRDEHGALLPVVFKSFGDWKPGLYIYTTVPSVAIFGLNEFSTRLPSAIAGILAVYLIYLLAKELFNEKVALFSAFFLAISAWHITFSRGAWEANLALTLTIAGLYFLISYLNLKNKPKSRFYLAAIFFGLSLWAYQSAKLVSLLILLGVVIFYKDKLLKVSKKILFTATIIGLVISLPIIFSLFSGKSGRLAVMSVFSNSRSEQYIEDTITKQGDTRDGLVFKLFHSEGYNFTRGIFGRYFNHFGERFLFFEGDWTNARHTSPNIGYLLLADFVFIIAGFIYCAENVDKNPYKFLLFWFAVSPLTSALSRDSVHGIRSFNMVIPLSLLLALGANHLYEKISSKKAIVKYLIFMMFVSIYVFNFAFFLDAYFIHGPIANSQNFMYGYKQVVEKITPVQDKYDEIVVNQNFDQAYIFFLFFQKYNPAKYQKTDNFIPTKYGDVGLITKLDNIDFRLINWSADKNRKGILLVGKEIDFPMYEVNDNSDYKYERITNLDGSPGFIIIEVL